MSKIKDVLLLWFFNLSNFTFAIWPIIMMYLANYQIHFMPNYSYKDYFTLTLFGFAGIPLGSYLGARVIFLFGIKISLLILGFSNFVCLGGFIWTHNFYAFVLSALLSGVNYSISNTCISYFLA